MKSKSKVLIKELPNGSISIGFVDPEGETAVMHAIDRGTAKIILTALGKILNG